MKQPRSLLLYWYWAGINRGGENRGGVSCCSDFCGIQPNTRKAMTSVILIFLLLFLINLDISLFHLLNS